MQEGNMGWILLIVAIIIVIVLAIKYWYITFAIGVLILVIYIIAKAYKEKKQREAWEQLHVIDPSSIRKINCGEICPQCPADIVGRWVYARPGPEGKVVQYHNRCGYYEIREDLDWLSFVQDYISAGAIRWPAGQQLILPNDLPPSAWQEMKIGIKVSSPTQTQRKEVIDDSGVFEDMLIERNPLMETTSFGKPIIPDGTTILRNKKGKKVGKIEKALFSDDLIVRDKKGKKAGRITQSFWDSDKQIIKDKDGSRVGEIKTDFLGRRIIVDKEGKKVGQFDKNIWGDTIIRKKKK